MKRKVQVEVEKKMERVETDEDEALGDDLELDKSGSDADDDDSDSSVYSDLEGEDDSEEEDEEDDDSSSGSEDEEAAEVSNKAGSKEDDEKAPKVDEYEYDSSDEEDIRNTIGNIPVNWYDEYGHIGYDVDGAPIRKPKRGDELDQFLSRWKSVIHSSAYSFTLFRVENPEHGVTVDDPATGQQVIGQAKFSFPMIIYFLPLLLHYGVAGGAVGEGRGHGAQDSEQPSAGPQCRPLCRPCALVQVGGGHTG